MFHKAKVRLYIVVRLGLQFNDYSDSTPWTSTVAVNFKRERVSVSFMVNAY